MNFCGHVAYLLKQAVLLSIITYTPSKKIQHSVLYGTDAEGQLLMCCPSRPYYWLWLQGQMGVSIQQHLVGQMVSTLDIENYIFAQSFNFEGEKRNHLPLTHVSLSSVHLTSKGLSCF